MLIWAAAMPIALVATAPFWHWLAATHFATAPFLFLAHFLFALGGILFWFGNSRAGSRVVAVGAVLGIFVALAAISVIADMGRAGSAMTLADGARDFLYLLHGAYAVGHCLVALSGFRGGARTTAPHGVQLSA